MFHLDDNSTMAIYEQIVWKIKELRLRGALRPGDKLPSVRELSSMVIANPNTVSKAYQELERQGIIETRQGKGTYVTGSMVNSPDHRQLAAIKERLRLIVIDAIYAGVDLPQIEGWLREEFTRLEGTRDA